MALVVVPVPVVLDVPVPVVLDVALAPGESDPAPEEPVELIPGEDV